MLDPIPWAQHLAEVGKFERALALFEHGFDAIPEARIEPKLSDPEEDSKQFASSARMGTNTG